MPLRTMITTATMVSRARPGSALPFSMTAEMIDTSMAMTEMVRIRVP